MFGRKALKERAQRAEERASFHFSKLWNIDRMIQEFKRTKGNSFTLIREIEKELDRQQINSSSK